MAVALHTPCTSVSASLYVALLTENPAVKPALPALRSRVSSSAWTGAGRRPWRGQCRGRGPGHWLPSLFTKPVPATPAPPPASADSCTRRCAEHGDENGAPGLWGLPAFQPDSSGHSAHSLPRSVRKLPWAPAAAQTAQSWHCPRGVKQTGEGSRRLRGEGAAATSLGPEPRPGSGTP